MTQDGTKATWEYATVPLLTHVTKQILDNWGQDGWELVGVVVGSYDVTVSLNPGLVTNGLNANQLVAYFKRPLT